MTQIFELGYSGFGVIDNTNVLATSGNLNVERNIPYINPLALPPVIGYGGGISVSKVQYAKGTKYSTGSISFDVNLPSCYLMNTVRLFKRGYKFSVRMFDGLKGYSLDSCYLNSASLSGSAGGLITASLSFTSICEIQQNNNSATWIRDEQPLGYWASGNINVRDWSLNFSQNVEPVFCNGTGSEYAHYMKIGEIEMSLDITTYERIYRYSTIRISMSGGISIIGQTKSEGYNFNGAGDLGTFSHSFVSSVNPGGNNTDTIIIG